MFCRYKRALTEVTTAHSARRLAVNTRAVGKSDIKPQWKHQRGRPCRTWMQQIEDDIGLSANDCYITVSIGGRYDLWPVKRSTD